MDFLLFSSLRRKNQSTIIICTGITVINDSHNLSKENDKDSDKGIDHISIEVDRNV